MSREEFLGDFAVRYALASFPFDGDGDGRWITCPTRTDPPESPLGKGGGPQRTRGTSKNGGSRPTLPFARQPRRYNWLAGRGITIGWQARALGIGRTHRLFRRVSQRRRRGVF